MQRHARAPPQAPGDAGFKRFQVEHPPTLLAEVRQRVVPGGALFQPRLGIGVVTGPIPFSARSSSTVRAATCRRVVIPACLKLSWTFLDTLYSSSRCPASRAIAEHEVYQWQVLH